MSWRLAGALVALREEINALAPNRSKASDGTIGDQAHRARATRHNPNRHRVVTALDVTHDPDGGCDIHAIAERIRRRPPAELAYIISNGRIASRSTGWAWHRYTGSNPHKVHAHFAVGQGPDSDPRPPYDSPHPWGLAAPARLEDDMTPDESRKLTEIHTLARDKAVRKLTISGTTPTRYAYVLGDGVVVDTDHEGKPLLEGAGSAGAFDAVYLGDSPNAVQVDRVQAAVARARARTS